MLDVVGIVLRACEVFEAVHADIFFDAKVAHHGGVKDEGLLGHAHEAKAHAMFAEVEEAGDGAVGEAVLGEGEDFSIEGGVSFFHLIAQSIEVIAKAFATLSAEVALSTALFSPTFKGLSEASAREMGGFTGGAYEVHSHRPCIFCTKGLILPAKLRHQPSHSYAKGFRAPA